jgi:hypothetical protein
VEQLSANSEYVLVKEPSYFASDGGAEERTVMTTLAMIGVNEWMEGFGYNGRGGGGFNQCISRACMVNEADVLVGND